MKGGAARWLAAALAVILPAGAALAAAADAGTVSGVVRDAAGNAPLAGVLVRIEGPGLIGHENAELLKTTDASGRFEFAVPPGGYTLWAGKEGFELAQAGIAIEGGRTLVHEFALAAEAVSTSYRVEAVPLPRQMVPEVSGVAFTPRGSLVAATRRGEVWIRDGGTGRWRRFAHGLNPEIFGVLAASDREIFVSQRPELTRLLDSSGKGEADVFETLSDGWGMTGNYHEFNYGLARDRLGNFYGANGMASREGDDFKGLLTRGQLKPDLEVPGVTRDPHRSVVPYQGWVYEVTKSGEFIPFASGFRQALGIGMSPRDELFATDVAGTWVPTSLLIHVEQGHFYNNPDGLKWDPDYQGVNLTPELLAHLRTPPAVYLPHGVLGTAAGQPIWDTTEGKFGPFGGQIFLGDVSAMIHRVDLERVGGEYQGAAFPFLSGQGLQIGAVRGAFGPDGSLYVSETTRGWMPTGGEGIQRVVWTGVNPVEIRTLRLTARGFALTFTEPMNSEALAAAKAYRVKRFQYNHDIGDGSLPINEVEVPVTAVRAGAEGARVELDLLELLPGFIYQINLEGMRSRQGIALAHPVAFYTANRLILGQTYVGKSALVPKAPAAEGPPDPVHGHDIFRMYCMICHQEDGKGSAKVGTPNFTAANSPLLLKPDSALVAQIVNGSKIMPSFANVLPPHDIRSVLAYLHQTFGRQAAAAAKP